MPRKTVEETHVDKINNAIQLIMKGKLKPEDAKISKSFERLKELNKPMYLDLMNDYKAVLNGVPTMD